MECVCTLDWCWQFTFHIQHFTAFKRSRVETVGDSVGMWRSQHWQIWTLSLWNIWPMINITWMRRHIPIDNSWRKCCARGFAKLQMNDGRSSLICIKFQIIIYTFYLLVLEHFRTWTSHLRCLDLACVNDFCTSSLWVLCETQRNQFVLPMERNSRRKMKCVFFFFLFFICIVYDASWSVASCGCVNEFLGPHQTSARYCILT